MLNKRGKGKKKKGQVMPVKAPKVSATIKFKKGVNIGSIDASRDSFLKECFIGIKAYDGLSSGGVKSILIGRTGTGKTAYIRHLRKSEKDKHFKCKDIDVGKEFVSRLRHLSEVIEHQSDQNLTLIFKGLWMHIITVRLIRDLFPSESFFQKVSALWGEDKGKKKLKKYVKSREDAIWGGSANTAEIVSQLTKSIEMSINTGVIKGSAKMSGVIGSKSPEADYLVKISGLIDMPYLQETIESLCIYLKENNKNYCVLVDELDDKWADDNIRYRLIRALIETVHHFYKEPRKIDSEGDGYPIKVVMALRQDLHDVVFENTASAGSQSEKYKEYESYIVWTKVDLQRLIEKRIQHLCEKRYTTEGVFFKDIFPGKVGGEPILDYILGHTLLRPRDVIMFVNRCLRELYESKGNKISEAMMKRAESKHSTDMYKSVVEEWLSMYPQLKIYTKILHKFPKSKFTFKQFQGELVDFLSENDCKEGLLFKWIEMYDKKPLKVASELLEILHKVSMVKVKVRANPPYSDYSEINGAEKQYKEETKIQIHPMVQSYYGVDADE